MGFDDSTPPEQLTGSSPVIWVDAVLDELPAVADRGEAEVLEPHRLEPRERHVHLDHVDLVQRVGDAGLLEHVGGQSRPPAGLTWSRPANMVGSLRNAVPLTQAGARPAASAASPPASFVSTMAHAPSEDGQVSPSRIGSQSIIVSLMDSKVASVWWRWA
jgi:hypothetical protein